MMDDYVLANNLKEMRARRNMTQHDLATSVGVTRKTVNTVENRVFVPSALLALKMAHALSTPVNEVFYLQNKNKA